MDGSAHLAEGAPSDDIDLLEVIVIPVVVERRPGRNGIVETIAPGTAVTPAAAGLVNISNLNHGR